jgi:hypothetical protein
MGDSPPIHKQVEAAVQNMNDQAARDRNEAARQAGPSAAFGAGGSLFEVDGMVVCGALLGGIFFGMQAGNFYGILGGAVGGAALGAAFAYTMQAAGWVVGGVFKAPGALLGMLRKPARPPASPVLPTSPVLPGSPALPATAGPRRAPAAAIHHRETPAPARPRGRTLLKWTLGGAILGAAAGAGIAVAVDAADAITLGAARVGGIGTALGFTMGLLSLTFRRNR